MTGRPAVVLVYCGDELVRFELQPNGCYRCPCCGEVVGWLVW